jgi:putative ABC transport system permease protein
MLQDLRFGLRILRRNPAFSVAAIFIIALGIAATCVIFSFAEAAVFRALPYRNPSRLVTVSMTNLKTPEEGGGVSVPVLLNWGEHGQEIGQFAVAHWASQTLVGGAEPAQVFGYGVSEGALRILGASPILGRAFSNSDFKANSPPVVILSYATWQNLFDGRRDVIGRPVTLDGVSTTIIGVMPPGFMTPESSLPAANWTPRIFKAKEQSDIHRNYLQVWGRLNPGVSVRRAQATLSVQAKQVMNQAGLKRTSDWRVDVTPLVHYVVKQWRSALIMLLGAVAFLLAIACVNVANLLLARANSREKEIAVRVAVGANRTRILRQLLTESAILGGFGGALGILMARWGMGLERQFLPAEFKFHTANFQQMGIDSTVLIVTVVVSILVGIIFGLATAFHASNVNLNLVESLKESGASATSSRGGAKVQRAFVIAEVALSLVLLMSAGLLLRSFLRLQGVSLGFNPNQLLTVGVLLPKYQYPKKDQQAAAYRQVLEKIKSLPGVQSSAFVTPLPLGGIHASLKIPAQSGMANVNSYEPLGCGTQMVSSAYFRIMGIPLIDGRTFTEQDTQDSEPVVVVNEAFARRYWPGQNPVGKEIFPAYPKLKPVIRVVGLVGNTRDNELWGPPDPMLYYPYTQFMFAAFAATLIARTRTPASTAVAMQKVIRSVDPEAPISQIRTMHQVLARSRAGDRFYLLLVGVFALLALVLAAAGIASTVSYAVSQRRHEIGIRMALGAKRRAILRLILSQILKLALVGIAAGIGGSLALTRFVASQLHGVTATDPLTFVAVSLLLFAVCLLASFIPAFRATSINPAETLRTV